MTLRRYTNRLTTGTKTEVNALVAERDRYKAAKEHTDALTAALREIREYAYLGGEGALSRILGLAHDALEPFGESLPGASHDTERQGPPSTNRGSAS